MTIWCEPEFFVKRVLGLGIIAKNLGWQIVLISFVTFLHQGRKVREKNHRKHWIYEQPTIFK
jgi:hypothetical protein